MNIRNKFDYIIKQPLLPILGLVLIYLLFSFNNFASIDEIGLWDFGREVYIPMRILQGKLLFKDIVNIFGPLSYQINATVIFIFGDSLNTFYALGILSGVVVAIYLFKISNVFVEKWVAFFITLNVLLTFFLSNNSFNIPYAFSANYALIGLLISVYHFLGFIKYKRSKELYIAFIFAGFSIANKYEHIPYSIVMVIYTFIYCKKYLGRSILYLLFFPAISLIELFSRGVTINDITREWLFLLNYLSSPSLTYLYKGIGTFIPYPDNFIINISNLYIDIILFLSSIFLIKSLVSLMKGDQFINIYKSINLRTIVVLIVSVIFYCIFLLSHLAKIYDIYSYVPLALLGYLGYKIISKKDLDKMEMALVIFSVISAFKCLNYSIFGYQTFLLALPLQTLLIVIYRQSKTQKNCIFGFMSNAIPTFLFLFVLSNTLLSYKLNTPKGYIRTNEKTLTQYGNAIKDIHKIPSEQVLVIPDGLFINYITNKSTDDRLEFMFMPPYMESYGEDKLIESLSISNIKYIVEIDKYLAMYKKREYGETPSFGSLYGSNVYKYIKDNYMVISSGNPYGHRVYERIN